MTIYEEANVDYMNYDDESSSMCDCGSNCGGAWKD